MLPLPQDRRRIQEKKLLTSAMRWGQLPAPLSAKMFGKQGAILVSLFLLRPNDQYNHKTQLPTCSFSASQCGCMFPSLLLSQHQQPIVGGTCSVCGTCGPRDLPLLLAYPHSALQHKESTNKYTAMKQTPWPPHVQHGLWGLRLGDPPQKYKLQIHAI